MGFSENEVYAIGAIIGMLIAYPLIILTGKYSLTYNKRHAYNSHVSRSSFFSLLLVLLILYAFYLMFYYIDVMLMVMTGCVVEGILFYKRMKKLNKFLFGENTTALTGNELSIDKSIPSSGNKTIPPQNAVEGMKKMDLIYMSIWISVCIPMICIATISALLWLMPDITVISKRDNTFVATKQYTLPYTRGTKPGGSYIDNISPDTICRVTVRYAYMGEELHNLFAVDAEYPPGDFARMRSSADYAMEIIPPVMLPSSNRTRGRYHTQRIFLTDHKHLDEFRNLDLIKFGLKKNIEFDSLAPETNRVIREDRARFNAYKVIDPDPYGHQ